MIEILPAAMEAISSIVDAMANLTIGELKDLVTSTGIVVGAFWSYMVFVRTRRKLPHANLALQVTSRLLTDKQQLLVVDVAIKNTGTVLLSLRSADVRVEQIYPVPSEATGMLTTNERISESEMQIGWKVIGQLLPRWRKGKFEIEPGETDHKILDFVIDRGVETVRVYAHFKNVRKRWKKIGWAATLDYNIGGINAGRNEKVPAEAEAEAQTDNAAGEKT